MAIRNHVSRVLGEQRRSIRSVSQESGVSYGPLFQLYHDRTGGITFDVLDRLCRTLRVTPCELFEYVPDEDAEAES